MAVLVDTNVLLFSIQQGHPQHEESIRAVEVLTVSEEPVFVLPQNIAEFWNTCTRPTDKNGLGLSVEEANKRLRLLEGIVLLLHESPAVYIQWRRLIVNHQVKGIQVHDTRIAAAMQVHGVTRILTYNPKDFKRFDGITAVRPDEVA